MHWVKKLYGYSGCQVDLFKRSGAYVVVKKGDKNLKESAEILMKLERLGLHIPNIEIVNESKIILEYINGISIQEYLKTATKSDIDIFVAFFDNYIELCMGNSFEQIDYRDAIYDKLNAIASRCEIKRLCFSIEELFTKLPYKLNRAPVHGDITFDNIIVKDNQFYLIDANPTKLNAVEYDSNKLRQDVEFLWFARHASDKTNYQVICNYMNFQLKKKWQFLNNDYILIFMLMRILPYAKNRYDSVFLYDRINMLWQ